METFSIKKILSRVILVLLLLGVWVSAIFVAHAVPEVAQAATSPVLKLSSNPSQIVKSNPYQEFTITVRLEGVSSSMPGGGLYGAEVRLTPKQANLLDFVRLVPSTDVSQSATTRNSKHKEGEYIDFDAGNNGSPAVTKDFNVAGYTFKLKQGVDIPASLEFECVDIDCVDMLGKKVNATSGTFTLNFREVETTNTLSALTLSAGSKQILSGTGDSQTITDSVAYADRGNVKISATRAGTESKIKVTDSVGNKTLVSERKDNLTNVSLGNLSVGEHTLTITVTSESGAAKAYTVVLTIAEEPATPIVKPTLTGSTTSGYSGSPVDFTPSGMAELVSSGKVKLYSVSESGAETEVGIDAFKPTDAGSYKIIARPANSFCWDGATGDAVYEFEVEKAVLRATSAVADLETGKMPTFMSESYGGSLDDIVDYKYYSDAECTQEIAKNSLVAGTKYYVKPVLKESAKNNFEFDTNSVTQEYIESGFEYEVPTPPEKNENGFLGLPWKIWILIAVVVVLIILIILIIVIIRKSKKKQEEARKVREEIAAAKATPQPIIVRQPEHTADLQTAAKTEKMDDRLWAMEQTAHEREITRYREEAEQARKAAERKDAPVVSQPIAAPVQPLADIAAQERVKELEARLRESEKEAHERELTRYKEEVERARKEAEEARKTQQATIQQPQAMSPAVHVTQSDASNDRVKELEARVREMEREAYEREISRYKEEAERAKKEAEEARRTQHPMQSVAPPMAIEERMRELEREAHERELTRYKENAEQARKAAEDAERKSQPTFIPQTQFSGMQQYPVQPSADSMAQERVKELEARLKEMERELQEHKSLRYQDEIDRSKKEADDLARKSKQQDDELARLRELQEQERRSKEIMMSMQRPAEERKQTDEAERLRTLEEQLRQQNKELQAMTEILLKRLSK